MSERKEQRTRLEETGRAFSFSVATLTITVEYSSTAVYVVSR